MTAVPASSTHDAEPATGPRPWRAILADAVAVPWHTVRLLGRHLPTLFATAMAGLVLRNLVIDLAVSASSLSGVLGQLVLVLAPLCILTSYVVILRTVRSSLPNVAPATTNRPSGALPTGRRAVIARVNTSLNEVGGLLVPFLVVYSTSGQLRADWIRYAHGVLQSVNDNVLQTVVDGGTIDGGELGRRMLYSLNVWIWILIGGAFLLRSALPWFIKNLHWGWLGLLAAYAESLWMISATPLITGLRTSATDWAHQRRVVSWATTWRQNVVDHLGPVAQAADWLLTESGAVLGAAAGLIVVPLSWLTVAAVVYGQLIAAQQVSYRPPWWSRARSRWQSADPRLRKATGEISAGLGSRFGQLARGVGLMRSSGVVSMVLLCAMFTGAQYMTGGLWLLERSLIGPHRLTPFWTSLDAPLSLFNDTITTMVLLCLVAAGVDRALRAARTRATPAPEPVTAATAAPPSSGPSSDQ